MARSVQASGVLAAPANTAARPNAANSGAGSGNSAASALPSVAPMANSGVTSPPLKPQASDHTVAAHLPSASPGPN